MTVSTASVEDGASVEMVAFSGVIDEGAVFFTLNSGLSHLFASLGASKRFHRSSRLYSKHVGQLKTNTDDQKRQKRLHGVLVAVAALLAAQRVTAFRFVFSGGDPNH